MGPDHGDEEAVAGQGARAVFFGFVFGTVAEDGGGGEGGIIKVVGEEGTGDCGVNGDGGWVEGG